VLFSLLTAHVETLNCEWQLDTWLNPNTNLNLNLGVFVANEHGSGEIKKELADFHVLFVHFARAFQFQFPSPKKIQECPRSKWFQFAWATPKIVLLFFRIPVLKAALQQIDVKFVSQKKK